MRWAIGFVVAMFCIVCGAGFAGEPPRETAPGAGEAPAAGGPEASGKPAVELGGLDMAKLMDMVRAELDGIEALKAEMEKTLSAIEGVNGEVAELRAKRLDQRLSELADKSPVMEEAIQKLRMLREQAEKLRTELQQAREAQKKLFDTLELGREEKDALRALLSDGGQPEGPPELVRDFRGGPQDFGDRGGRRFADPGLAQRVREQNERRREEYQRRLAALEQQDPEMHALLVKKVELIEQLDGPRVGLAEHVQTVQRVLQELQRRLVEFYQLTEAGSEL